MEPDKLEVIGARSVPLFPMHAKGLPIVFLITGICVCRSVSGQFTLNGDATALGGDCYQLTNETTFSAGSIWYDSLIDLSLDFEINFTLNLGDLDATGADGLYFVLQPVGTGLGAAGGGMGYEGIVPSLGVEFDTYQNGGYSDPAYDHVAIQYNGVLDHAGIYNLDGPVQILAGSPNAEDGEYHDVRITWDAEMGQFQVYVDCAYRVGFITEVFDIIATIFGDDPEVYFGFTGGTGSLFNNQIICFSYTSELDALEDVSICPGDSVQLILPEEFTSYSWSPAIGLSDVLISDPWASPETTTTYTVIMTDACGFETYDTVVVSVLTPDFVDLGEDLILCDGQSWTFNVMMPGATYVWNDGSTLPTLTINEAGTYSVVVTDGACVDGDTVQVDYLPAPDIQFPEDTVICGLDNTWLISAETPGATYVWQDGSTESSYLVTEDGLYFVTVTVGGCTDKDSVLVSYASEPIIDLGPDQELCPGAIIILNAGDEIFDYVWQDGATGNQYTVAQSGMYSVVMTVNGCSASDSVLIVDDLCVCEVIGPGAFSPNGDQVNDFFTQLDCTDLSEYTMRIYNRWGELIFETADVFGKWDGTWNGEPAEVGTYIYTMTYTRQDGSTGLTQGNVILLR